VSLNACALLSASHANQGGLRWSLVAASLFMTATLCAYAVSPFVALKLPWKYAACVVFFPAFLVWKLIVVAKGRPHEWVRTAREPRVSQNV
jgi:hypothetical protein